METADKVETTKGGEDKWGKVGFLQQPVNSWIKPHLKLKYDGDLYVAMNFFFSD